MHFRRGVSTKACRAWRLEYWRGRVGAPSTTFVPCRRLPFPWHVTLMITPPSLCAPRPGLLASLLCYSSRICKKASLKLSARSVTCAPTVSSCWLIALAPTWDKRTMTPCSPRSTNGGRWCSSTLVSYPDHLSTLSQRSPPTFSWTPPARRTCWCAMSISAAIRTSSSPKPYRLVPSARELPNGRFHHGRSRSQSRVMSLRTSRGSTSTLVVELSRRPMTLLLAVFLEGASCSGRAASGLREVAGWRAKRGLVPPSSS